ncbi:hypothetical protein HG536_0H02220 [Torulaspora globosa]|uniref:Uncharacterized protein n=1 Tax=Torulaspora globosa TaxID=48254 RepID=A0A7G3ZMW1_9SACH|nr:uncharacterized protein HG536_0H02220 [Torulaspora globosa]QLL34847.1 hypothetical protein HG536_0H02220 [Torulaspora globosa]
MSEGTTAVNEMTETGPNAENEVSRILSGFLGVSKEELGSVTTDHVMTECILARAREFNDLQSNNMKLHATIDEMKVLCSRKVETLQSKVEDLTKNEECGKEAEIRLREQVSQLTAEKELATNKLNRAQRELQDVQSQKDGLIAGKQDIVKLLDEKIGELEASKKETNDLLKESKHLRQRLLEVENEIQDYKSKELSNKSEIEVMKQQVALLTKNNEWLEKDIMTKTEQFIKYRKENDVELQASLRELASIKSEFQVEKTSREFLTAKNHELSKDLQAKLLEVKSLSDTLNTERQEFSREMSLKQKLIELLEEQVGSLQKEIRLAADNKASDIDNENELSLGKEGRENEVALLQQKLEASEHECLRLEAVVRDLLGEGNEEKDASPASRDLSSSRIYGDLSVLKKQLIKERHQKENLQRQVESFIVELEYKIPFINSLKDRTSALEKELNDAALLLEHTSNEKEKATRELEVASGKIEQYETNINTLVRQRSDLARQVQFLLVNVSVHNDSRGPLTDEETAFIRRLIENEDPGNDSDSQRIITERLVEFKDIVTLQQRNSELLKTVRNLAAKLEEEELKASKKIDSLENETINEAKQAIVILQEYNAKMESQMEIITKERDAYKAILSDRESAKESSTARQFESLNKDKEDLIKDLEHRLSTLSAEASKNVQILNEEIQNLHKIKTDLTVTLEKERSSRTLAEERLKLLQGTLEMAKQENAQLLKRFHDLENNMSSQEVKTTETVNKFIACQSRLSVLESKAAYLEEEKSILMASNETMKNNLQKLMEEKNSLTIVITQLQTLQSERETLLKDTHASYKEKLNQMQQNLSNLTSTIESKEEKIRTIELSRDDQIVWYQTKMDTMRDEEKQLQKEITEKQALIGQLRAHIEDITKRLEEKESNNSAEGPSEDVVGAESSELKVRHNLEKMSLQLKHAYSQVEQYKEMSSAVEESYQKLQSQYDCAKEEFDSEIKKLLSEKSQQESEISRLKNNIDFLNNEYAAQRNKTEQEKHELSKRIFSLEGSKNALHNVEMKIKQEIDQLKSDLKQQTVYANVAQSNYEEELQRHAEAAKVIRQLRAEVETERIETQKLKASEHQARELLESNEKNWFNQKAELERDLETYKERMEDLSNQNKLLFDQIQLFSNSAENTGSESHAESRELLTNLRRERDILETKLTVSKREEKVLHQRLLSLEDELSEMRKKLLKSQADDVDQTTLAKQHSEIMEQLNQMNLLRESNITLRNAANAAQEKNVELQKELANLQDRILPLECEIENCRRCIEERDQEIEVLRDETERWKARSHDILRRQEKIDPEELKKLEEQVASLQEQLKQRIKENTDLDDRFNRLKKQAHEKLNASKITQANLSAELNDLAGAKTKLEEMLKEAQVKVTDLERMLSEKDRDSATINDLRNELETAVQKAKEIEATLQETTQNSEGLVNQLNGEISNLKQQINALKEKESGTLEQGQEKDISTIVESMKKDFEEEKINFVHELRKEYGEKLEEEKAKLSSQLASSEEKEDLNELKRRWEETQEEAVLRRIKEAEENLKKRIRMPTEERINKVLEKRKAELEEEFQRKLSQNTLQSNQESESLKENLREELQKEFETKYEELLGTVKKKAFEEGKQQAAMKSTLLERKISKLEAQLNKGMPSSTEPVAPAKNNGIPSKIDERNGVNIGATQLPVSGEKVLKLLDKPSFQLQKPSSSNPFTSGPPANDNALEMKPAFTIPLNHSNTKSDSDVGAAASDRQGKLESTSPQPGKEQQKENTSDGQIVNSKDLYQQTGEASPLKRPADSLPNDGTRPKREKQESSQTDH